MTSSAITGELENALDGTVKGMGMPMPKLVDALTLEQWRTLAVLHVLEKLGCYAKRDVSFHPVRAKDIARYHVNANGAEWELLVTRPKFWDMCGEKGGGGAIDLTMHLFKLDFKNAVQLLRSTLSNPLGTFSRSVKY